MSSSSQKTRELSAIKESVKKLFLGQNENISHRDKDRDECEVCSRLLLFDKIRVSTTKQQLSDKDVSVILQAMVIESKVTETMMTRPISTCSDCTRSFKKLCDLFQQLRKESSEKLRTEFNNLRMNLGKKVIEGTLGKNGGLWEEEIERSENGKLETSRTEDSKVQKMNPVVILERLVSPSISVKQEPDELQEKTTEPINNCQSSDTSNRGPEASHEQEPFDANVTIIHREPQQSQLMENETEVRENYDVEERAAESSSSESEPTEPSSYRCLFCDDKFKNKFSVSRHVKQIHKLGVKFGHGYTCPYCQMGITAFEPFHKHLITRHPSESVLSFKLTKSYVWMTEEAQAEEKEMVRLINESKKARAAPNSQLSTSKRKRNKEPGATCPHCLKYFSTRTTFRTHLKHVHNNERSFECPDCKLKFKRKHHLKVHVNLIHLFTPRSTGTPDTSRSSLVEETGGSNPGRFLGMEPEDAEEMPLMDMATTEDNSAMVIVEDTTHFDVKEETEEYLGMGIL